MEITFPPEMAQQVQEAGALKTDIIKRLKAEFPDVFTEKPQNREASDLLKVVELGVKFFDLVFETHRPNEMNTGTTTEQPWLGWYVARCYLSAIGSEHQC